MNLEQIKEYIKENKEVSLLDIKEKFNLSESEIKVLKPFLITFGISLKTVNEIHSICEECPLNSSCKKKSTKDLGCCN